MAKAPVVEEAQLRDMIKIAAVTGESPVRDVALLYALYGLGLMVTEVATLSLETYLKPQGTVRKESEIPVEVAYNGEARPLFWSNAKVCSAIDAYLDVRVKLRHGLTTKTGAYRGLDPRGPIFRNTDGEPYRLTERWTPGGVISYSCDTMSQVVRRLHAQAGVDGASGASARRTFAVRLHRKGIDLRNIAALVGHKNLASTRRLVDCDPVSLGDLVSRVV